MRWGHAWMHSRFLEALLALRVCGMGRPTRRRGEAACASRGLRARCAFLHASREAVPCARVLVSRVVGSSLVGIARRFAERNSAPSSGRVSTNLASSNRYLYLSSPAVLSKETLVERSDRMSFCLLGLSLCFCICWPQAGEARCRASITLDCGFTIRGVSF
jgi:hypothetical protein